MESRNTSTASRNSSTTTQITPNVSGDVKTSFISGTSTYPAATVPKEILAWKCSESLDVQFVLDTMEQLQTDHGSELGDAVLVHSDQGSHYTSCAFRNTLKDSSFIQSMSRKGNCWDNQRMEYFFSGLKDHIRGLIARCQTYGEVVAEVSRYIDYYNNERFQWKLAKLSPAEFYQFCNTGIYPLAIEPAPDPPIPEKDPAALKERADKLRKDGTRAQG